MLFILQVSILSEQKKFIVKILKDITVYFFIFLQKTVLCKCCDERIKCLRTENTETLTLYNTVLIKSDDV